VRQRYQAQLDYLDDEKKIVIRRNTMTASYLELAKEFPEYKTLLSIGTEGTLIFNFESESDGVPEIRSLLEALRAAKVNLPPCE
jgi:hypothetical protein